LRPGRTAVGGGRPGAGRRGGGTVRAARAALAGANAGRTQPARAPAELALLEHLRPLCFVLMSQVGFLTHLVPLISGRPDVDPGLAVAINAVMALAGRVVLGFVIDRLEPRLASALCFLVQVAAIAVLARAETPAVIYGACALYGFSVGNNITLSPLII